MSTCGKRPTVTVKRAELDRAWVVVIEQHSTAQPLRVYVNPGEGNLQPVHGADSLPPCLPGLRPSGLEPIE